MNVLVAFCLTDGVAFGLGAALAVCVSNFDPVRVLLVLRAAAAAADVLRSFSLLIALIR